MPDNLKNTGPADDSRINVNQPHEVQYWCKKFGCTPQQLAAAVNAVGPMVTKVRAYLGK